MLTTRTTTEERPWADQWQQDFSWLKEHEAPREIWDDCEGDPKKLVTSEAGTAFVELGRSC